MDTAIKLVDDRIATVARDVARLTFSRWEDEGTPTGMEKFVTEWNELNEARMTLRAAADTW